jgi:hypothetical protein
MIIFIIFNKKKVKEVSVKKLVICFMLLTFIITVATPNINNDIKCSENLVLGVEYTHEVEIVHIFKACQETPFFIGRHNKRIQLIDDNTRLNLAMGHLEDLYHTKVIKDRINFSF